MIAAQPNTAAASPADDSATRRFAPILEDRGDEFWYLLGARCSNACIGCLADQGTFLDQPDGKHTYPRAPDSPPPIFITGREPTLLASLSAVFKGLSEAGWTRIGLITNGIRIATPAAAKRIRASGVFEVRLKVFDSTDELWDAYTRSEGSRQLALRSLAVLAAVAGPELSGRPLVVVHQALLRRVAEAFDALPEHAGLGHPLLVMTPPAARALPFDDRATTQAHLKKMAAKWDAETVALPLELRTEDTGPPEPEPEELSGFRFV